MKEYKLGYVASKLNAPTKRNIKHNMEKARTYEKVLNQITGTRNKAIHGYVPAFLDEAIEEERQLGLQMGLQLLSKSDAIILCGTKLTNGMNAELKLAVKQDKKVFILKGKSSRFTFFNKLRIKSGVLFIEKVEDAARIQRILDTRRIL